MGGVGSTYGLAGFTSSRPSEPFEECACSGAGLIVVTEEVMISGGSSRGPFSEWVVAAAGSVVWAGAAVVSATSIRFSGLLLRGIATSEGLSFSGALWRLGSPAGVFSAPSSIFTECPVCSWLEVASDWEGSGGDMQGGRSRWGLASL